MNARSLRLLNNLSWLANNRLIEVQGLSESLRGCFEISRPDEKTDDIILNPTGRPRILGLLPAPAKEPSHPNHSQNPHPPPSIFEAASAMRGLRSHARA